MYYFAKFKFYFVRFIIGIVIGIIAGIFINKAFGFSFSIGESIEVVFALAIMIGGLVATIWIVFSRSETKSGIAWLGLAIRRMFVGMVGATFEHGGLAVFGIIGAVVATGIAGVLIAWGAFVAVIDFAITIVMSIIQLITRREFPNGLVSFLNVLPNLVIVILIIIGIVNYAASSFKNSKIYTEEIDVNVTRDSEEKVGADLNIEVDGTNQNGMVDDEEYSNVASENSGENAETTKSGLSSDDINDLSIYFDDMELDVENSEYATDIKDCLGRVLYYDKKTERVCIAAIYEAVHTSFNDTVYLTVDFRDVHEENGKLTYKIACGKTSDVQNTISSWKKEFDEHCIVFSSTLF